MIYFGFKRLMDILLAIFLMVMLFPIYFIIGLIIYLQDFGHPLFRQSRVGKTGREFNFYKFRSMPLNSPNLESHQKEKLKVTPFGKFIRRTNIDELPQFWNVLIGDMSFIGPRPPIPSQTDLIEARRANGSLALRPGLTGWAQVNSYDGMAPSEKARFDGEYAKGFSFLLDLKILFATVKYFTKKPPTY